FNSGARDRSAYDETRNLGYMWNNNGGDYRGTAVLSDQGMTGFYGIDNNIHVYSGVSEATKYMFLSSGLLDTTGTEDFDRSYCISTGPYTLAPGESEIAAFAVLAASSLEQLNGAAEHARDFYRAATPVYEDGALTLPTSYRLEQNFPNPFNPETNISFTLPKSGRVNLEVFNLLGQRVATLLDQELPAGNHQARWAGIDDRGQAVASGLYLYRLQAEDFSAVRKMLLLK
ncbi:MAG: T9SS type A sorting domain-containing protein, partial [bacterium]